MCTIIVRCVLKIPNKENKGNNLLLICAIILSISIGILGGLITISKKFNNLTTKLANKTFNDSPWYDVLNFQTGNILKIYLKNKSYYIIGAIRFLEENSSNPLIVVTKYSKYTIDEDSCNEDKIYYKAREDAYCMIRLDEVEYIEVF